jgi:hypothetical protein
MEQVDHLLAGADVTLDDEILDRIDEIAPPGTDAGPNRRGRSSFGVEPVDRLISSAEDV